MIEFLNLHELQPWELRLVKMYPAIYLEPNPNLRHFYTQETYDTLISNPNFTNLRYGFEFKSGWSALVEKFSKNAQDLVYSLRRADLQPDAFINACIFKERMGLLTWQGDDNLDEPFKCMFRAYVHQIEKESASICEITGADGCMCARGAWLKVLCYDKGRELGYEPISKYDKDKWDHYDSQIDQQKNNDRDN